MVGIVRSGVVIGRRARLFQLPLSLLAMLGEGRGVADQSLGPRMRFGPSVAGARGIANLQRQLHHRFAAQGVAGDSPGAMNFAARKRGDGAVEDAPAGVLADVLAGRQEGQSGRGLAGRGGRRF
jgi:hypothetical protein